MPPRLLAILDDLAMFPDRADRIEALIGLGEEFRNPPPEEFPRTEAVRVPGCESEAFVAPRPGGVRVAVDNPQGISAMAMGTILEKGLEGATPDQARAVSEEIVYDVFGRELSMGKNMGLTNMVRMAKNAVGTS